MIKLNVHIVLFFAFSLSAWNGICQSKNVVISVSWDEVSIGQTVQLTIKSNMDGELVENLPSSFIQGYGVNTYSQYIQDVNTGEMVQEHVVVLNGAFSKSGTYKIGPFYVKDGNKSKGSNIVSVKVISGPVASTDDFSADQLKKPAFGIIERSSEKVYEGQALVLNARIYSTIPPVGQPVRKRNYEVRGIVESHDLDQFSKNYIEPITIKGKNYSTFIYDKKLIFPTTIGELEITPYSIMIPFGRQVYDVQSNVPKIEVLPLPPNVPKDFIGGVGKLTVSQSIETKKLKTGDVFIFDVVISGNGNLHNLDKPKLPLPKGMIIYGDPVVTEEFTYGSNGAVGRVTYSYNVQVTKTGSQYIPAISLSYFDPIIEKYVTTKADSSKTIMVDVNPKFDAANVEELAQEALSMDKIAPLSEYKKPSSAKFFGSLIFWIAITTPVTIATLFLFFSNAKQRTSETKLEVKRSQTKIEIANELLFEAKVDLQAGNITSFYSKLSKSLLACSLAKAKLDVTLYYPRDFIFEALQKNGVQLSTISDLKVTLSKCDEARFGMIEEENADELERNARELLTKIVS